MTNDSGRLAKSVQARLNNLARARGGLYQETVQYYATERFLYRLSKSDYRDQFILKGGVVFTAWGIPLRRTTKDIDLHGVLPYTIENIVTILKNICQQAVPPDGLRFDADSIYGESIQGRAEHEGVRLRFMGYLGNGRLHMQIDVGFSDIVTPPAIQMSYPSLLGMAEPHLHVYAYETVIAEKLQAMVFLGRINSRMKDFYDIWLLSVEATIDGSALYESIKVTFKSRSTKIPNETPFALTHQFALDKQKEWAIFVKRSNIKTSKATNFADVIKQLNHFFMPVLGAINAKTEFSAIWTSQNHWLKRLEE